MPDRHTGTAVAKFHDERDNLMALAQRAAVTSRAVNRRSRSRSRQSVRTWTPSPARRSGSGVASAMRRSARSTARPSSSRAVHRSRSTAEKGLILVSHYGRYTRCVQSIASLPYSPRPGRSQRPRQGCSKGRATAADNGALFRCRNLFSSSERSLRDGGLDAGFLARSRGAPQQLPTDRLPRRGGSRSNPVERL